MKIEELNNLNTQLKSVKEDLNDNEENQFILDIEKFIFQYKKIKKLSRLYLKGEIERLEKEISKPKKDILKYAKDNGSTPLLDIEEKVWEENKEVPLYRTNNIRVESLYIENPDNEFDSIINPLVKQELPIENEVVGGDYTIDEGIEPSKNEVISKIFIDAAITSLSKSELFSNEQIEDMKIKMNKFKNIVDLLEFIDKTNRYVESIK